MDSSQYVDTTYTDTALIFTTLLLSLLPVLVWCIIPSMALTALESLLCYITKA